MSKNNFSTTPRERYLEDYVVGAIHEFGPVTITEDEIVQLEFWKYLYALSLE